MRDTLQLSYRADFCVGYFNLRDWQKIDDLIEQYAGGDNGCRLLIGMQNLPSDEVRTAFSLSRRDRLDSSTTVRHKKQIAAHFRQQLTTGAPTNRDEAVFRFKSPT
ncbi:hypothetical protein [Chroogloeocystis siderophila]|jgi:hypothetical protein|uniref:hypothetical protein n=1 Tax=Chroogloeocystis siderophila TaxID=329163 RepID=UPI001C4A6A2D|nr:hypothetical protein [Chroogloeocystis siderophila]